MTISYIKKAISYIKPAFLHKITYIHNSKNYTLQII